MQTEIERVAREVRVKCLKFALSDESIGKDYHKTQVSPHMEDLEMMCLVASTALAKELRNRGVDRNAKVVIGKYDGEEHSWVLSRGLVVDITATQFRRSEVEIWPEEVAVMHWEAELTGDPGTLDCKEWGDSQSPTDDIINRLLTMRVHKSVASGITT